MLRPLASVAACARLPGAVSVMLLAVPKINLGTCCGSSPDVGLAPWLKAGGTGIDTAWS